MEPKAEMVHWLFGAGVLLLGLIMFAEVLVGEEVWRLRPWRIYLWPGIAFALGVLMWPVMAFYTNSAIHMVAHGTWAQALMAMGAVELGLAKGKLHNRWWRLARSGRDRRLGPCVSRARAEPVVLRACRIPPPRDGLVADRRLAGGARDRFPAPFDRAANGLRDRRRRALGAAFLRPRRRADLRSHLTARGAAAPMRRAAVWLGALALALPAAGLAHATLNGAWPGFQQELTSSPKTVRLHFDQFVTLPSIQVLNDSGRNFAGSAAAHGLTVTAPVKHLPDGAYTVRWHALSADSHVVSGVWTFGVGVQSAAADRGLRRWRADPYRARRPLALLRRVRARDRLARASACSAFAGSPCRRQSRGASTCCRQSA